MKKSLKFAQSVLDKMVGLKVRTFIVHYERVVDFVKIDFGKRIKYEAETEEGIKTFTRGEWRLSLYMCSWRIDKNDKPLAGSFDSKKHVKKYLKLLKGKKLIKCEILNKFLDTKFYFEDSLSIFLFSCCTDSDKYEHWSLLTPDRTILVIGPANNITYLNPRQKLISFKTFP
jgi:hypothetical protein